MTSFELGYAVIEAFERGELTYDEAHSRLMAVEPLLDLELFAAAQCM